MTALPEGLPAPVAMPDGLDAPYWDGLRRHELVLQRCGACGRFQWGPEWVCHYCRSFDVGWAPVGPRGVIYSWERVWHPVHPALEGACPYVVVLVELPHADGVRLVGNLLGDPRLPVEIGHEVTGVFEDHDRRQGDGFALLQWERTA